MDEHRRALAARDNAAPDLPANIPETRRMNNHLRTLQDKMDNLKVRMVEVAAGLPQHAYNPALLAPVQPSAPVLQHLAPGRGNI